jgi:nucleoid DNA-binding protein
MTKAETVELIAQHTGCTKKKAASLFDEIVAGIKTSLFSEGRCQITGLGTLRRTLRKPRKINVLGRGVVEVPAKWTVRFQPAQEFKAALNAQPFATAEEA